MVCEFLALAWITVALPSNGTGLKSPSAAEIRKALDTPTGNPSECAAGTKFFPQPVDHATWDGKTYGGNQTFLQQFEIIDKFYKPGGPILFFQGAENPSFGCNDFTSLPIYAEQLGALVLGIEHRYFGISIPFGLNYSEKRIWPTELLKPLTLDNVLDDGVSLLNWVKSTVPGAHSSKVIIIGGTYDLRARTSTLVFIGYERFPSIDVL